MMTPEGLEQRVKTLIRRGYTDQQAEDYAVWIGDVIEIDHNGKWVVRDESGKIVDRIDPIE
jgi:hypothetical protein